MIYLDNSATTLKPKQVIEAVNHFYCDITANAHRGDYELSQKVDQLYEETRKIIARMLNCDPLEVAYTSGTTYGVNQVAWGYVRAHLNKGDVILITEAEHASNVLPWFRLADECGFKIEYIPLNVMMEGIGAAGHPSAKTHVRMGKELANYIRKFLGE